MLAESYLTNVQGAAINESFENKLLVYAGYTDYLKYVILHLHVLYFSKINRN